MNAALQADLPDPSFEALQKLPADQRGLPFEAARRAFPGADVRVSRAIFKFSYREIKRVSIRRNLCGLTRVEIRLARRA